MAKFFINRPIVAMVISILMVLMGLVAMARLPIAQFPQLAPPQITFPRTGTRSTSCPNQSGSSPHQPG